MEKIKSHKDLDVWRVSVELVQEIYSLTDKFPCAEKYGLSSQMRRAVSSIPSNISEGAGRKSTKEFKRFLSIASGSLSELDTQLELSQVLGYAESTEELERKIIRIRQMLAKLMLSLSNRTG